MKNALIIFIKNPVLGKVKTRLAKTMGEEKALFVYQKLLAHTNSICEKVNAERFVYYSDFIDLTDEWIAYQKRLQTIGDLGKKMQIAFDEMLNRGFSKAVIIGSDCPDISTAIIAEAFAKLDTHEIVIGPAADGGYYLLGMKTLHSFLFDNKSWSTDKVLQQTLTDIVKKNLSYHLLPELNDIDEEKDLAGTQLMAS